MQFNCAAPFNDQSHKLPTAVSQNDGEPLPRLAFSLAEVGGMLGVSEVTIRRLVDRRLLKRVPGVRHLRITASSLHAYVTRVE